METFKKINRFMPYDTFSFFHFRSLKNRILSDFVIPSKYEESKQQAPITTQMMKEFDNQSMAFGSVHSDLGKRRLDQVRPDNISMTSSAAPVGEISQDQNEQQFSSPSKKQRLENNQE